MSVGGHIYGVVLNDREELDRLAAELGEAPYEAPPRAPVVYIKPRSTIARGAIACTAPVVCAPTLALLMARDAARLSPEDALACVGAVSLALDVSLPQASYYRPAIGQQNADGFLVLGDWVAPVFPERIATRRDGRQVHAWSLDRLQRPPATLLAELSAFMTLRAGDVLLVGLPGDAPRITEAGTLRVEADALPAIKVTLAKAIA